MIKYGHLIHGTGYGICGDGAARYLPTGNGYGCGQKGAGLSWLGDGYGDGDGNIGIRCHPGALECIAEVLQSTEAV